MAEIAGQPAAIRRAAAAAVDQADASPRCGPSSAARTRVVLTGMGSSYDACYPAATRLAAAGVLATMVDAAELLHFRLDALEPGTLLVCVSQSGESAETVRVVRELRERGDRPCIAVGHERRARARWRGWPTRTSTPAAARSTAPRR